MRHNKLFSIALIIFTFALSVKRVNAQSSTGYRIPITTVIPPSPNVSAMQKYGDIPVSTYTGIPDIKIPLYTLKFHDVSIPISVSYHASGIKVAEEASNVGLGWVLNAGGMISRNIVGADDFQTGKYFNTLVTLPAPVNYADGYMPYGIIQQSFLTLLNPDKINTTVQDLSSAFSAGIKPDFQPDEFYFSMPGENGKFILKRNYQAILEAQTKIDITCNADGTIWQILTPNGFNYTFSQVESFINPDEGTLSHMSAVYLTQIKSPTGNIVTYHYKVDSNRYVNPLGSYSESLEAGRIPIPGAINGYNSFSLANTRQTGSGKLYNSPTLDYIDCQTEQIQFSYSNDRTDIPGDRKLTSIKVYSKDYSGTLDTTKFKSFDFNYDYFLGVNSGNNYTAASSDGSVTNIYSQRLKLNSITESGTLDGRTLSKKPYQFSYYVGGANSLPLKTSFARDHWGYFNGSFSNISLIPSYTPLTTNAQSFYTGIPDVSRNSNKQFMQAFSLSDITYPTGGLTHFDYESNDCDEDKSEINDFSGSHYKNTILPDSLAPTTWNKGDAVQLPQVLDLSNKFSDDDSQLKVSESVTFVMGNTNTSPSTTYLNSGTYVKVVDFAGNEVARFNPGENSPNTVIGGSAVISNFKIDLPPGLYHMQVYSDFAGYSQYLQHVNIAVKWYTKVTAQFDPTNTHPTTYSIAGGLRIKRITNSDGNNPLMVKKYIYHAITDNGVEYSYGRRMAKPEYTYTQFSEDAYTINAAGSSRNYFYLPEHVMRTSDSNIPLNGSAQGMVVGYDQVTENFGENGENGKVVYVYHNNPDTVLSYQFKPAGSSYNTAYPRLRPYNSNISDPLNGSLIKKTTYKNVNGLFLPVRDEINTYQTRRDLENDVYGFVDRVEPHFSSTSGDSPQSGGISYESSSNDRFLYTYPVLRSNWNFLSSNIVKDYSDTDTNKYSAFTTKYYYDNANHFQPTRTVTQDSKGEIITTTVTYPLDYNFTANTDDDSKGIANLTNKHIINSQIEKYVTKSDIDGSNARTISSMLTSYGSFLPLPTQISRLNILRPLSNFASFTSTGLKSADYQSKLFFDKFDPLNGNVLEQHNDKDIHNSYIWGYNYKYPIADIKNATYQQVLNVLGQAAIDQLNTNPGDDVTVRNLLNPLRAALPQAQVTTYTYSPQAGMTSMTDSKGMTITYEYDSLQRLVNIRDNHGDIVKHIDYHYQNQ